MLPIILGGIALAATGYKLKKHLDDDENYEKLHDSLINGYEWINKVDYKVDEWCDRLEKKPESSQATTYDVDLSTILNRTKTTENILEPLQKVIYQLYKTLFLETEGLKRSIKNLRRDAKMPLFDDLSRADTLINTHENKIAIQEFCDILANAERFQYRLLDELETPFSEVNDFEQLSNEDKVKAIRLMEIDELMHEACQMAITYDGVVISRMAKRAFRKINNLLVFLFISKGKID